MKSLVSSLFFAALFFAVPSCAQWNLPSTPREQKPGPTISGIDSDGEFTHLSDYRGKVVLVDFWFTGCHWCQEFHKKEPGLLKRYAHQPFVLVGVNTDPTRDMMMDTLRREHIAARTWWDGPRGPIAEEWKIGGFPTLVLVDHLGNVRGRWDGMPPPGQVETKIDQLLHEVEEKHRTVEAPHEDHSH